MSQLEKLRKRCNDSLALIEDLKRDLGDRDKVREFASEEAYDNWRYRTKELLDNETRRYRELKQRVVNIERKDFGLQLLREVWKELSGREEFAILREKVRLFVRDYYGIYLKDKS